MTEHNIPQTISQSMSTRQTYPEFLAERGIILSQLTSSLEKGEWSDRYQQMGGNISMIDILTFSFAL